MLMPKFTVDEVYTTEGATELNEYVVDDNKRDVIVGTHKTRKSAEKQALWLNLKRLFIPVLW